MAKYRKKPIVIDAAQWWPPGDDRHDPAMLSHRKGNSVNPPDYRQVGDLYQLTTIKGMGDDVFFIKTLEGPLKVSPGDWIITGIAGERYPCKPDIFAATYEPADKENGMSVAMAGLPGDAARLASLLNRAERMEEAIREFIRINHRDEYEFESNDPAMWAQLNASLEEQPT